jgi:hypothetical protein
MHPVPRKDCSEVFFLFSINLIISNYTGDMTARISHKESQIISCAKYSYSTLYSSTTLHTQAVYTTSYSFTVF